MGSNFESLIGLYNKFNEISDSENKSLNKRVALKTTKKKTLMMYISSLDRLDFELTEKFRKSERTFDLARVPMVEPPKNDNIYRDVSTKNIHFFHRLRKENQEKILNVIEEQILNYL